MSDIQARLRFDITQFQNALNQVRGEIKELKATAKSSGKGLGSSLFGGLKGAIAGLGMAKLTSEVFDAVLRFDSLEKTLRVTEGSAEGAARRFAELREVGRNPGLSLEAAVQGDIRLRAVGMTAAQSTRILLEMGNALSLVGGSQEDLSGVLLALTQISSKGKVFAEEINQINERLPQVRTIMKEVFGTSVSEDIQKMNLDANDFIMRLVDGFAGLERAQSGMREDLTELGTIFSTLANDAFAPLIHELIPAFRDLAGLIAENKTAITDFGSSAASAFRGLVDLMELTFVHTGTLDEWLNKKVERDKQAAIKKIEETQTGAKPGDDPFKGVVRPRVPGTSGGSSGGGDKKEPDIWKEADKQLQLQRRIDDIQKKTAEDGMSIQEKVLAKQKEVADAQKLESIVGQDGSAEAKLEIELKRLELQRELNQLREEESRVIKQAADDIDREADEERKLALETAKTAAEKKKQRDAAIEDTMLELEVLRLRSRGQDKKADKLQKQQKTKEYEDRLLAQGASPEFAAAKAKERADLEEKIERRKNGQPGRIGGVREKHYMTGSADGSALEKFHQNQGENHRSDGLASRGRRDGRMMGRSDEGGLSTRATRAAGAQDAQESKDTSTKDLLGQIAGILTTGLLG